MGRIVAFYIWDDLSLFGIWDELSLGTNCRFLEFGTNCRLGRIVAWDELSPNPSVQASVNRLLPECFSAAVAAAKGAIRAV